MYKANKDAQQAGLKIQAKNIVHENFGNIIFLNAIMSELKIKGLVERYFPEDADDILGLIMYEIINTAPSYLYRFWQENHYLPKGRNLYSKNISALYHRIGENQQAMLGFQKEWIQNIASNDAVFFDITSFSSYSKNLLSVERGYNRDGKISKAHKRVLIITKTTEPKPKVKYSISNGDINAYSYREYAYFVSQRYWVERSFDNAKNELGMSDYQIRKWQSWHTHHAIIMLASLLITTKLIESKKEIPLLSFKDTRILIVTQICKNQIEMERKIRQMHKRHIKRKADIDWNYNRQKLEQSTNLGS